MKHIKLFEWSKDEFDFLAHITELATPLMDSTLNQYTKWGITRGKFDNKNEIYEFILYVNMPTQQEEYVDENNIFYNTLLMDSKQLDNFLTEKLIPVLNKSDYLDNFSYIAFSLSSEDKSRVYEFTGRLGKSFIRGKNANMWT